MSGEQSLNLNPNFSDVPKIEDGAVVGNYKVVSKLGEGSYSAVHLAKHQKTGVKVAVKFLYNCDKYRIEQANTEIKTLQVLSEVPFVVNLLDHYHDWKNCSVLVLPLLGADLETISKQNVKRRFNRNTICKIGSVVIKILEDVHGLGFLHRSIKGPNLCFRDMNDPKSELVLIDWGMSREFVRRGGSVVPVKEKSHPNYHRRGYAPLNAYRNRNRWTPLDDIHQTLFLLLKLAGSQGSYDGNNEEESVAAKEDLAWQPQFVIATSAAYLLEFSKAAHEIEWQEYPNHAALRAKIIESADPAPMAETWAFETGDDGIRRLN